MSKLNKKSYIGIFIAIFFAGLALFFTFQNKEKINPIIKTQTTPSQQKVEPPLLSQGGVRGGNSVAQNKDSVTVSAGDTTIHLQPNIIFYDALIQEKKLGKIAFSGKNYPGLGFFVTEIGTLQTSNGKNLLYYINGKQASVGVSAYTLKDGDVIEWKLE